MTMCWDPISPFVKDRVRNSKTTVGILEKAGPKLIGRWGGGGTLKSLVQTDNGMKVISTNLTSTVQNCKCIKFPLLKDGLYANTQLSVPLTKQSSVGGKKKES